MCRGAPRTTGACRRSNRLRVRLPRAARAHIFLKPTVTRLASRSYGFDFRYASKPSSPVYANLLEFAGLVRRDLRDLRPRDMIDIQSFIWVQGSEEYT